MRILIYGINYAPELTGIGKYTGEMASWFVKQGHTVHMVTGMPYYPEWKKETRYRGKLWHKEIIDGVHVYRCPLYVPEKVNALKRIIHEFSFTMSTIPVLFKKLFAKKYDVVISVSPPFHLGFLPTLYGMIRNSPVITHIQDLQIDVAKNMGMIGNKHFLRLMYAGEKFLLNKSKAVTTISEGMLKKIHAKGVDPYKCRILPNWVDEDKIMPLPKERSLRKELGFSDSDKIVLYSGNLGEKQGLEDIIQSAAALRNNANLHFVIVGSGGIKQKLEQAAKDAQLNNVHFVSLQSYDRMAALMATADIHLVLQKKSVTDLVMPSKLATILAAGGVSIVTASSGSTLYDIVSRNNIGFIVEPENVDALINGISTALKRDLRRISENARAYAEKNLARESIMQLWHEQLLIAQGSGTITGRVKTMKKVTLNRKFSIQTKS
jgi:colanic acid biosynthesis glycosyl transferase WcaI